MGTQQSIWDKLKMLNDRDSKNGTKFVQVSNILVKADKVKQGGLITMGVSSEAFEDIATKKDVRVLLLVVDGKAFDETNDMTNEEVRNAGKEVFAL